MSQKAEFHHLEKPDDGLLRELAPGVITRIFAGEQAMLSVVTIAPNAAGIIHHTRKSNGAFCSKARRCASRAARRSR